MLRRWRSRPASDEERAFVLRVGVRDWGMSMFALFFASTELLLPLLAGGAVAALPWLALKAVAQLLFWIAAGYWFGRLLWRWLPPERRPL